MLDPKLSAREDGNDYDDIVRQPRADESPVQKTRGHTAISRGKKKSNLNRDSKDEPGTLNNSKEHGSKNT